MVAILNVLSGWSRDRPFHNLPNLCPTGWLSMGEFVRRGVRPLQVHFQKFLGVDETVSDFLRDHYVHSGQSREGESVTQFWERQRSLMIPDDSELRHVLSRPVACIALIISRLPCIEAGVERAFSSLGFIYGDHQRSIHDDLVEALLIIKLHRVPDCPASSSVLETVRGTPGPDSVDHPAGDADGARSPPGLPGDGIQPASEPEPGHSRWRADALERRIEAQPPDGDQAS
jgi:hypothetical protein